MEMVVYTVVAIILYLVADRFLERIEIARGARFEYRSVIFFFILAGLALLSFWAIRTFFAAG